MLEAVKHFVDDTKDHGLLIINRPTGDGKTFDALHFIHDHLNDDPNTKFFYLTPLIKNVKDAYEKLKKHFFKGNEEVFDSKCVQIKSNCDCVIENFANLEFDFKEPFTKLESFRKLRRAIDGLETKDKANNIFYTTAVEEIRSNFEPAFRKDVEELIQKDRAQTPSKRLKFLRENHPYLIKLYPSIESIDKQVFFMTIDKFYYGNDTLIDKGYRFINNSITKNAIIFIDEFDSTKSDILNQEIQDSVQQRVDIGELFHQILGSFTAVKTPPRLLMQVNKNGENLEETSAVTMSKIQKVFEDTSNKYSLDRFFKYVSTEKEKSLLFNDFDLMTINASDAKRHLIVQDDEEKRVNLIKSVENDSKAEEKADDTSFKAVIQAINGSLTYFVNGIAMIARNYQTWYNQSPHPGLDDIESDSAISTVLHKFDLDQNFLNLLTKMIANNFNSFAIKKKKSIVDTDFYNDGFRYYSLYDKSDQNECTTIYMVYLGETPESFMANLCARSRVIGLSATGTIETVTGNYDLQYLKRRLGTSFVSLSDEDKSRMKSVFDKKQMLNKSKISVYPLSCLDNSSPNADANKSFSLNGISNNPEVQNVMYGLINNKESKPYNKKRFIKVIQAIKHFLFNKNSHALLVITNRNAKQDESDLFSKDYIEKFIGLFEKESGQEFPHETLLLYGSEFESNKASISKHISEGKKVIALSSYPASGTGQNLQYVVTDEEGNSKEEDIDSLYLEKPTNMFVSTYDGLDDKSLLKYIYQVEALGQVGDISKTNVASAVNHGFKIYLGSKDQHCEAFKSIYSSSSVNNHGVKNLNQACGRICRVYKKEHDVNIYLDDDIYDFNYDCVKSLPLNKEFAAIVVAGKNYNPKPITSAEAKINNLNSRNCEIIDGKINHLLSINKTSWAQKDMEEWENIRLFILHHPTISQKELLDDPDNCLYRSLYVQAFPDKKINQYYYDGKYNVSFTQDDLHKNLISADELRLSQLLSNKYVKNYFEANNLASSFVPNEFMLNPVAINNLYRGALGETIGKFLFELLGIKLLPITDPTKFEKFDFVSFEYPNVFVDFKYWNDKSSHPFSDEELQKDYQIAHIQDKISKVNAKKVFIVNILSDSSYDCRSIQGNVFLVPGLIDEKTMSCNGKNANFIRAKFGCDDND
ncbi:MAG: DEAD/DEAH box helicase family protein [Bacilli bacterium]